MKRIRTYRGMTQKELGIRLGYKESTADVRIAQYESDQRRPKTDTLYQMAEILEIHPFCLVKAEEGSLEELLQTLLWMEEENPDLVQLYFWGDTEGIESKVSEERRELQTDRVGIRINDQKIESMISEWLRKRAEVKRGILSEAEYLEWKWGCHYKEITKRDCHK
ncbi:MAG: helix-turn-helix domain-containing protein [Blautia sp.]